ncbi:MAG: hypothetical protein Q7V10_09385 [Methanobacteriaceae archaeon]|jgi:carbonic anhydrase|nr:hypothetical protein [Methanobacteriaceae archaeon]MDO9627433.1 hypothetical protein [Methanobacteriaceae archaeon]
MKQTPETSGKFATCLNCIDGRIQFPVLNWIKINYGIPFVDMITEPGIVNIFSDDNEHNKSSLFESTLEKVKISLNIHDSNIIFLVGHDDCAGNPESPQVQKNQTKKSVRNLKEIIKEINPSCKVIGLWIPLKKDLFYDSSLKERYIAKNLAEVDIVKNIKIILEL